jgi:hypothetical protein
LLLMMMFINSAIGLTGKYVELITIFHI